MRGLHKKLLSGIALGMLIFLLAAAPAASVFASSDGDDADGLVLARETAAGSLWDAAQTEAFTQTAPETAPILYEIETPEVPLAALPSMTTWAFSNLLIALVCFVISAATLVSLPAAARRRAREEVSDEYSDYRACIARDLLIFKLLGAGVGAASAVLFLLTENVHGAMQAANGYTWLMALILFTQVAILFVAFRGKRLYDFDVEVGAGIRL
jgi:hypothetical protein